MKEWWCELKQLLVASAVTRSSAFLHYHRTFLLKTAFFHKYHYCMDQYKMYQDMKDLGVRGMDLDSMMANAEYMADVYKRAFSGAMTQDTIILDKLNDQFTRELKLLEEYQKDKCIQELYTTSDYMFPGFRTIDDQYKPQECRNISHVTCITPIEELYDLLGVSKEDHMVVVQKLVFETMEFNIDENQIFTNWKTAVMVVARVPERVVSNKAKSLIQVWLNHIPDVCHQIIHTIKEYTSKRESNIIGSFEVVRNTYAKTAEKQANHTIDSLLKTIERQKIDIKFAKEVNNRYKRLMKKVTSDKIALNQAYTDMYNSFKVVVIDDLYAELKQHTNDLSKATQKKKPDLTAIQGFCKTLSDQVDKNIMYGKSLIKIFEKDMRLVEEHDKAVQEALNDVTKYYVPPERPDPIDYRVVLKDVMDPNRNYTEEELKKLYKLVTKVVTISETHDDTESCSDNENCNLSDDEDIKKPIKKKTVFTL
jgi:hypothetical protein